MLYKSGFMDMSSLKFELFFFLTLYLLLHALSGLHGCHEVLMSRL